MVFSDDSYDFNFQVRRWLLLLMVMVHAAVVVVVVAVSTLEIVNSLESVQQQQHFPSPNKKFLSLSLLFRPPAAPTPAASALSSQGTS